MVDGESGSDITTTVGATSTTADPPTASSTMATTDDTDSTTNPVTVTDSETTTGSTTSEDMTTGTTSFPENCGDGVVDDDEECDGDDLNGANQCSDIGDWTAGTLNCRPNCTYSTEACTQCGNGDAETPIEQCDGNDLADQTCTSVGAGEDGIGSLGCTESCTFDTSQCSAGELCGNGTIDEEEQCDSSAPEPIGTAIGCEALDDTQYSGGAAACDENCAWDTSQCESDCGGPGGGCAVLGGCCSGLSCVGVVCG